MSRHWKAIVLAAGAFALGITGAVAGNALLRNNGARDDGLSATRFAQVGETVAASDVSATLAAAAFTAAETRLEVDFATDERRQLIQVLVPAGEIEASGIASRPPTVSDSYVAGGVKITLSIGPATSPEVTVTIHRIILRYLGGEAETVEGPWTFHLDSGSIAADPIDIVLAENELIETAGTEVRVSEARLTSSGLSASFTVGMKTGEFIGFEGYPARLIRSDGTWIGGRTIGGGAEDGSVTAVFGQVESDPAATLEFGPFLRKVDGPFKAVITLPGSRSLGAPIELGQAVDIGGYNIVVQSMTVREDGFSLTFTNTAGGRLTVDRDSRLALGDDLGNRYEVTDLVTHASEDSTGSTTPEYATIIVKGKLHPGTRELTAEFSSIAISEVGPRLPLEIP